MDTETSSQLSDYQFPEVNLAEALQTPSTETLELILKEIHQRGVDLFELAQSTGNVPENKNEFWFRDKERGTHNGLKHHFRTENQTSVVEMASNSLNI